MAKTFLFDKPTEKIAVSLAPNGFKTEKGEVFCGFSILLGLVVQPQPTPRGVIPDVIAYMSQIRQMAVDGLQNLQISVGTYTHPIKDFLTITPFGPLSLWDHLLSGFDFTLDPNSINNTDADNVAIHKELSAAKKLFPFVKEEGNIRREKAMRSWRNAAGIPGNKATAEDLKPASGTLAFLHPSADQVKTVNQQIIAHDSRYADIRHAGKQFAGRHADKAATPATKTILNLPDIIHSLFQHPQMARRYGLILDFYIPVKDLLETSQNPSVYISEKIEVPKTVQLTVPNDDFLPAFTGNSSASRDIKSQIHCIAYGSTVNSITKYYHGLANWGLIAYDPANYTFKTVSADRELQQQQTIADAIAANQQQGDSLIDFSDIKGTVLEGIYLYRTGSTTDLAMENNSYDPGDGKQTVEIGILGQNVAVNIDGAKEPFSLCRRYAEYRLKYPTTLLDNKGLIQEEGWIHTHVGMKGQDGSYHPQTVFSWTGSNLCVLREKLAHQDQKLTPKEITQQGGGMHGAYSNQEDPEKRLLAKNAFSWKYRLIPGKEVQLVNGMTYSFWIRQVLCNGYTLPLKTVEADPAELTLADLQDADSNPIPMPNFRFITSPFNLNETPINSPLLLANKLFHGKGPKTTESEAHLVTANPGETCQRLLFPSAITLQFGQLLGLFSQNSLQANTRETYYQRGMEMVTRAMVEAPRSKEKISSDLPYLADTRGVHLVITPGDWITRNYLLSFDIGQSKVDNNISVRLPSFFPFSSTTYPFYAGVSAGSMKLITESPETIHLEKNGLTFCARSGSQLKWQIQLQDDLAKTQYDTVTGLQDPNQPPIYWISYNHLPGYPRATFYLTNSIARPDKPKLKPPAGGPIPPPAGGSMPPVISITADRPSRSDQRSKSFFTFTLDNINPLVVKQIQLNSAYTQLSDDGHSLPAPKTLEDQKALWIKQHAGDLVRRPGNSEFLINEYPPSVFYHKNQQILTDAYMNNFGFSLTLDSTTLQQLLPENCPVVKMNVGTKFDVVLVKNTTGCGAGKATLTINDTPVVDAQGKNICIDLTQAIQIILTYSLQELAAGKGTSLALNIVYNGVAAATIDAAMLIPYPEFCEQNITLYPKFEQYLLTHVSVDFQFVHAADYFSFINEPSAGYLKKEVQISALSRFAQFFPHETNFCSAPTDPFVLICPNNTLPVEPVFSLTALLAHDAEKVTDVYTRKRSMQILFEIDRPLQNNEQFGLIISEGNTMTTNTCAIGRDLTTYSIHDFFDANNPKGYALTDFLLDPSQSFYLAKYYQPYGTSNATVQTYGILPLDLFYEKNKDKWIAVIALDQDVLRDKSSGDAYNPFVKIVAVKYAPNAKTGYYISSLTKPKYINLLTERKIITHRVAITDKQKGLSVTIDHVSQTKKDNKGNVMTYFVAGRRKRWSIGRPADFTATKFQVLKWPEDVVPYDDDETIYIFEFETFSDASLVVMAASANFDWLNEHRARLIYMEEL